MGGRTQDPVLQVFFLLKMTRPFNVSLGKPPGIFGKNKAWMHFKPTFSINQFTAATSFLRLFRTVRSRTGARDILTRRLWFVSFGGESPWSSRKCISRDSSQIVQPQAKR